MHYIIGQVYEFIGHGAAYNGLLQKSPSVQAMAFVYVQCLDDLRA